MASIPEGYTIPQKEPSQVDTSDLLAYFIEYLKPLWKETHINLVAVSSEFEDNRITIDSLPAIMIKPIGDYYDAMSDENNSIRQNWQFNFYLFYPYTWFNQVYFGDLNIFSTGRVLLNQLFKVKTLGGLVQGIKVGFQAKDYFGQWVSDSSVIYIREYLIEYYADYNWISNENNQLSFNQLQPYKANHSSNYIKL